MVDFAQVEVAGLLEFDSSSRFLMMDAISWNAKILLI